MYEKIKELPFFKNVGKESLIHNIDKGYITIKVFNKGEIILHQNDLYDELYMIIKGQCYSEMLDFTGKNVKIDDFYDTDLIGAGVLFSTDNKLPVSIVARSKCEMVVLKKNGLTMLCMSNEDFFLQFMNIVSDKVSFLTKKIFMLSFKSIKSKIAGYLMSKLKADSDTVVITLSLEELSNYFGVARPSLSRVISKLEDEKIISHDKNIYRIHDIKKLKNLV